MHEVQLRAATAADIPAILAVTAAAYAPYVGRLQPPSSAVTENAETVARYLQKGGVIVAAFGDTIVGAVRYEPHEDCVYLRRLAVAPAWQGQGIGRRLVEAVEDWTVLLGLDEVRLGVRRELEENRALYEHLGFVVEGLVPFSYDPRYAFVRMSKRPRDSGKQGEGSKA